MKIYDEIEKAVIAKLEAIEGLKHIAVYNEQYENSEKDDPIKYPAVFVEILDDIVWKDMGDEVQAGGTKIRLHCVNQSLLKTKAKVYDFSQAVFEGFQNQYLQDEQETVISSNFQRIGSSSPKRSKNLKIIKIDFAGTVYDFSRQIPEQTWEIAFQVNR
jgi:hypothetical protein